MTVNQLRAALDAIPEEFRGAEVWQSVIEGRMLTQEVRLFTRGQCAQGEPPVVILTVFLLHDLDPPADLVIVPGQVQ